MAMSHEVTVLITVWASIGPLVGILVGHLLTRSWERRRWLLDARKAEFKELVSNLAYASMELVHYLATKQVGKETSRERWNEAFFQTQRTMQDRIYIADDLDRMMVGHRFFEITNRIQDDSSPEQAARELDTLMAEIKETARHG